MITVTVILYLSTPYQLSFGNEMPDRPDVAEDDTDFKIDITIEAEPNTTTCCVVSCKGKTVMRSVLRNGNKKRIKVPYTISYDRHADYST